MARRLQQLLLLLLLLAAGPCPVASEDLQDWVCSQYSAPSGDGSVTCSAAGVITGGTRTSL